MKRRIVSLTVSVFMFATMLTGYCSAQGINAEQTVNAEQRTEVTIKNPSFEDETLFTTDGWKSMASSGVAQKVHSDEIDSETFGVDSAYDGDYVLSVTSSAFANQNIAVEENSTYELTFYHTKTARIINICAAAKWDATNEKWAWDDWNSGYQDVASGNTLERSAYSQDVGNGWYKRVVRFKTGEGLELVKLFTRNGAVLLDDFKLEKVVPDEDTGIIKDPSFESSFINYMSVNEDSRGWVNPNSNERSQMYTTVVEEGQLGGLKIPDGDRAMKIDTNTGESGAGINNNNLFVSNRFDTMVGTYYKLTFYSSEQIRNLTRHTTTGFVEAACRNLNNNAAYCKATGTYSTLCSATIDSFHTSGTNKYDNAAGADVSIQCIPMTGELEGWYQYETYFKALEPVSQVYLTFNKKIGLDGFLYLDDFRIEEVPEVPANRVIPNNSFEEPINTGDNPFKWSVLNGSNQPIIVDADALFSEKGLIVPDGKKVVNFGGNDFCTTLNSTYLARVKPGASYRLTYYSAKEITRSYVYANDYKNYGTGYFSVSPKSNANRWQNGKPSTYDPDEYGTNMTKTQVALTGELAGWYLNTIEFTMPTHYPTEGENIAAVTNAGEPILSDSLLISGRNVYTYVDNLQLIELREEAPLTFAPSIAKTDQMKPFNVTIDGIPENASVYYTETGDTPGKVLDGVTKLYDKQNGIVVNYGENKVIKAIVVAEGAEYPEIVYTSPNYSVKEQLEAPVLPSSVTNANAPISITMTPADGSKIYYTVNGDIPDRFSTLYVTGTPLVLPYGFNNVVKAIAISSDDSKADSEITEVAYSVKHINDTPVLPDHAAWQDSPLQIVIPAVSNADVYYTTNGEDPVKDVTLKYTEAFTLPHGYNGTVKAIAITEDNSRVNSLIASKNYSVKGKMATPQLPAASSGKADAPITITIPAITGAKIYYTTSGDNPIGGTEYEGEFVLPLGYNGTVKAIAVPDNSAENINSDVASVAYGVKDKTIAPSLPESKTGQNEPIVITIPEVNGAKVYYSTGGGNPLDGELYDEEFILDFGYDGTVKAIAVPDDKDNYINSDITETAYSVNPKLDIPEFEPNGGKIVIQTGEKALVKIKNLPDGADAYYAIYNEEPPETYVEENWIKYEEAGIELDMGIYYIRAYMSKADYVDSDISGVSFNVINQNLADAIDQGKSSLVAEFEKFAPGDYTEENWAALLQIKDDGLAALELCTDEAAVTALLAEIINGMNAIEKIPVQTTAPAEPTATSEPTNTVEPTDPADQIIKPKSVKLNKKKVTLKVKKSIKLKASLSPKKISAGWKKLTWKSSKPKIAKVNKKGKVTARKKGKTKIIVKTKNKKKAKCVVTVKK